MKIAAILVLASSGTATVSAFHAGSHAFAPHFSGDAFRSISHAAKNIQSPAVVVPRSSITTTTTTKLRMAEEKSVAEQRKDRIVTGHQISSTLFAAVAGAIVYQGAQSTIGLGLPLYAASGPFLAAGVSYILAGAASAGRLGSGTYKRLALFQTEFNLCGLSTVLLAVGGTTLREQLFYGFSLASLLSLSPSLAGYMYGEQGLECEKEDVNMIPYLKDETVELVKGFFNCKNLNSFVYLAGTWFVATLKVLKLVEMVKLVMEGNPAKTIATRAVRFGRLALLTGVMYALKDAADRDRLEGSTFIKLNALSSAVLGSMSYYLKTIRGAMTPLVWATTFFSAFTALNGCVSIVKKSRD